MNMEDKILWSERSFDISFVKKLFSSGSPPLLFLTCVEGGSMAWGRGGLVMKTSCQQCVSCGNSSAMLEFQICLLFDFRSCCQ